MPRSLASVWLALIFAAACHDDALPPGVNACVTAGGRCVARPTTGPGLGQPQCDADELSFSPPPQLCDDPVEDCCFRVCPVARPQPGDACSGRASCQYHEGTSCVQAICIDGHWWLSVSACPSI